MPQTEDTQPANARPAGAGEAQETMDTPAAPEPLPETEDFPVWLHSGG